jgi:hypothetical protein
MAAASGEIRITPPFKPHLEDKLWLALLWSPALKKIWEQSLRGNHLKRLQQLVPFGWVLDPTPLPPHAALPRLDAHSWEEVAGFSQKDRQLVLKVSGFHETAWGSRGVFIGHDMPSPNGPSACSRARPILGTTVDPPGIPAKAGGITHPVFRDDGSVEMMQGRARLCPYFFTDDAGENQLRRLPRDHRARGQKEDPRHERRGAGAVCDRPRCLKMRRPGVATGPDVIETST